MSICLTRGTEVVGFPQEGRGNVAFYLPLSFLNLSPAQNMIGAESLHTSGWATCGEWTVEQPGQFLSALFDPPMQTTPASPHGLSRPQLLFRRKRRLPANLALEIMNRAVLDHHWALFLMFDGSLPVCPRSPIIHPLGCIHNT